MFKAGDEVIAVFDIEEMRQDLPATYVTEYKGCHWVITNKADRRWFKTYDCNTCQGDEDGVEVEPCRYVRPMPKVEKVKDWKALEKNTELLVNYTTRAWFADCLLKREHEQIAVYVNENGKFVTREDAVSITYINKEICFLPVD